MTEISTDQVFVQEVIICTIRRRGEGKSADDPIRVITEIFTKEGIKIAEHDPHLWRKNCDLC
jgi:hypothetical protein